EDCTEHRMGRWRSIQIIDVASSLETLTDYREQAGVLRVGLRDFKENVGGALPRQAPSVDNSQQCARGFTLMMLGFSQWLHFIPRCLLLPCLGFLDDLLLKRRNPVRGEDFGWEAGHREIGHGSLLISRFGERRKEWFCTAGAC